MTRVFRQYPFFVAIGAVLPLLLCACRSPSHEEKSDPVIVLDNQKIYPQDLVREGINPEDSGAVTRFVDTWVSDRLFAEEAVKMIDREKLAEIDRLVDDYKQMLLRNIYEKQITATEVDSNITKADIQSYYQKNKQKLSLGHKILRYRYIRVPKDKRPLKNMLKLLKSRYPKDLETLKDWCRLNSAECMLNDTAWYKWSSVKSKLPSGLILNGSDIGKSVRIVKKGRQHFFYLAGYKSRNDTPPVSYIEDYLRKSILFERKKELIKNRRKELYNKAVQQGKLRVHLSPGSKE